MGSEGVDLVAHAARVGALPLFDLRKKLMKKASIWGLGTRCEDFAQGALLKLVQSGGVGWDHVADPTAWRRLVYLMNEARKNARKMEQRHRTDVDTEVAEESPPSSDNGARTVLLDREEATWARAELLRRFAGSPFALRMVEVRIAEGHMEPAELAERLQEDRAVVYRWNAKILAEMKKVRSDWNARNAEGAA